MDKKRIRTDRVSAGKVALSQAIQVGDWLFCSGQIPRDPKTGQIVTGGITEQTRQVLEGLKAVCEAAGTSLSRAVKVTVYMRDLSELLEMNKVFQEYFGVIDPPARTTVQVASLIDGAKVEIELTAFL